MLDALSFSDETAIGWGISIERERKKMLLCAVILAGASTAFAGNIGFIGLLAPHAAKKVVGNGHRVSLLLAALIAAVMLIFCRYGRRKFIFTNRNPGGNCGVAGWCTVFCIPDVEGVARIWKQ